MGASLTSVVQRCFIGRMKSTYSDLEQRTFDYLLKHCASSRGILHKFTLAEYFSTESIDRDKLLAVPEVIRLPISIDQHIEY